MNFMDSRLPERFWSKVQPCAMSGCWLWTGATSNRGYGVLRVGGKNIYAHRFVILAERTIETGCEAHHRCHVRCCVNPDHLRVITRHANRSEPQTRKTHCPEGHAYDQANTYRPPRRNARGCLACRTASNAKHKRAAA